MALHHDKSTLRTRQFHRLRLVCGTSFFVLIVCLLTKRLFDAHRLLLSYDSYKLVESTTKRAFLQSDSHFVSKPKRPIPVIQYNKNDTRPLFLLHVGLPKTATTYLQCSLCENFRHSDPVLKADNFTYVGTCPAASCSLKLLRGSTPSHFLRHDPKSFFDKRDGPIGVGLLPHRTLLDKDDEQRKISLPSLTPTFKQLVTQARQKGHHAMVIFEGCHQFSPTHIQSLSRFLTPLFQVHVLVAYRPLYEWLPSKYNSISKPDRNRPGRWWPGSEADDDYYSEKGYRGAKIPPFDIVHGTGFQDFDSQVAQIRQANQHPAQIVQENYQRHFDHVHVLPLHLLPKQQKGQADPLLKYIFCDLLRGTTPRTCREVMELGIGSDLAANPSVPPNYDLLAVGAFESGLIKLNKEGEPTRQHTVRAIAKKQESRNLKPTDFELTCWSNETQQEFETLSMRFEEQLFGEVSSSHHESFVKSIPSKLCHVNVNKTLQDPFWRKFFEDLSRYYASSDEAESDDEEDSE